MALSSNDIVSLVGTVLFWVLAVGSGIALGYFFWGTAKTQNRKELRHILLVLLGLYSIATGLLGTVYWVTNDSVGQGRSLILDENGVNARVVVWGRVALSIVIYPLLLWPVYEFNKSKSFMRVFYTLLVALTFLLFTVAAFVIDSVQWVAAGFAIGLGLYYVFTLVWVNSGEDSDRILTAVVAVLWIIKVALVVLTFVVTDALRKDAQWDDTLADLIIDLLVVLFILSWILYSIRAAWNRGMEDEEENTGARFMKRAGRKTRPSQSRKKKRVRQPVSYSDFSGEISPQGKTTARNYGYLDL